MHVSMLLWQALLASIVVKVSFVAAIVRHAASPDHPIRRELSAL
jgi:hypothetical protein